MEAASLSGDVRLPPIACHRPEPVSQLKTFQQCSGVGEGRFRSTSARHRVTSTAHCEP